MKDPWPPTPPATLEPSFQIPLGPFVLHDIVGKGGMGEVWRGVHRQEGTPVAVKVITGQHAQNPRFVTAFRREVQTIAALDHPGIIMVLDVGEVPGEADRVSEGRILSGSPYMAMECADGGGLGAEMWGRRFGWYEAKAVLMDLLDALAHAHARGIVHLDFKPDNVLWCQNGDTPGRWKLSDFGIAHAVDQSRSGVAEQSIGTPSFMAPEQIMGLFRDYGPWTDLYALGCTAYQMLSGSLPFSVKNLQELANLHLYADPPPLAPHCIVPEGFEGWVQRLLQKSPRQRFQRAADAAWALARLEAPADLGGDEPEAAPHEATALFRISDLQQAPRPARAEPPPELATAELSAEEVELLASSSVRAARFGYLVPATQVGATTVGVPPSAALPIALPPPLPPSWRRPSEALSPRDLLGAGLGLFGLRPPPMVGREPERDAIWEALRDVDHRQHARVVVLYGSGGCGKSRLAEWICERAHEVGGATILRAFHSPEGGPTDGLPRMVARHLRCVGLDLRHALDRTERLLREQGVEEAWEWEALTDVIDGALDTDRAAGTAQFDSLTERYSLIRRLVERVARERPSIVWLDDVQYSLDTLAFVKSLQAAQALHPSATLVLMTVQAEALAERPEAYRMVSQLLEDRASQRIDVAPLSQRECERLVRHLLGLERTLAREVAARAQGNPLFAVQLVGDWVQGGKLELGADGFQLRGERQEPLADDLHDLWADRLARLLAARPEEDQIAVELAATLGQEVTYGEWGLVCHVAVLAPSMDLIPLMVAQGFWRWTEDGFGFVHGMMRQSALRLAREAGRSEALHRACASMLEHQARHAPQRGMAERLAYHLIGAEAYGEAIDPLQQATDECLDVGELLEAEQLLNQREALMTTVQLPANDVRWVLGWNRRAELLRRRGEYRDGLLWAQHAEQTCSTYQLPQQLAESVLHQAVIFYELGHHDQAEAQYRRARRLFDGLGDVGHKARCEAGLADIRHMRGELDAALENFERVLSWRRQMQDRRGIADTLFSLASVYNTRGDLGNAMRLFEDALKIHEEIGNAAGVVNCLNGIGEVDRAQGRLKAAEERYWRVLSLYESMGSGNAVIARVNIALTLLAQGRYTAARPVLEEVRQTALKMGRDALLGGVHAELLPCAASDGDWAEWDHHMKQASILLSTSGVADPDDAWPAQLGGDIAASQGEFKRAKAAWSLARRLWERLGREEKVQEIDDAIERLGD